MNRVNKNNPCPVCGKTDWCLIAEDSSACICARISEGGTLVGHKGSGWLHKLTSKPLLPKKYVKPYEPPKPLIGFMTELTMKYHRALPNPQDYAKQLGVSPEALDHLLVGFDGRNYSWPMKNGKGQIIGIRLAPPAGKKFCVKGSQNGLFWPVDVKAATREILFVCEGGSDCAALLDLGFSPVGRPSCNTGFEHLKEIVENNNRTVVIFADKDEAKKRPDGTKFYPGQEGAEQLAKDLKPFVKSIRIIRPPRFKDVREWYRNGATREAILLLVKNARFV